MIFGRYGGFDIDVLNYCVLPTGMSNPDEFCTNSSEGFGCAGYIIQIR